MSPASAQPAESPDESSCDVSTHLAMPRILVVRLSAMGDVIHTLPAVQALRAAFPQSHIGWLIEERWAELLCAPGFPGRGPRSARRPLVDEVHTVNLKGWGKSLISISTLKRIATVWNDVRGGRYDVAVDIQGSIRSALLARWSGAPAVYGAADSRESPASLWYTRKIVTTGRHVIEQNVSVTSGVVRNLASRNVAEKDVIEHSRFGFRSIAAADLPCDAGAEERVDRRLAQCRIRDFAILNPGAGWGAKRWPASRYGEVACGLAQRGLASILNYGPGEDELVRAAESASGGTARPMQCTITELIALTRRAQLFIGGDTGPLHLAAALRVPVVGIYGPTDPVRNGPYGTRSIVLRSAESITSHTRRTTADEGMLEIGSEAVLAAADQLLRGDS